MSLATNTASPCYELMTAIAAAAAAFIFSEVASILFSNFLAFLMNQIPRLTAPATQARVTTWRPTMSPCPTSPLPFPP